MASSDAGRLQRAGSSTTTRTVVRRRASRISLRTDREHCIGALKRLVDGHGTNRFFDKAMILLTRHWADTPWSGRAELLRATDWLIRVGADFHE
jgi:hypothetical protein